jgi:hypothetical protein
MTIFNTGPNAITMDFNPGDIGYVKKNLGHYIQNTGDTDLQVIEVFRAPQFMDVSLSDWITHTPPALVAQHLNVSAETIAKFPRNRPEIGVMSLGRSRGFAAGLGLTEGIVEQADDISELDVLKSRKVTCCELVASSRFRHLKAKLDSNSQFNGTSIIATYIQSDRE